MTDATTDIVDAAKSPQRFAVLKRLMCNPTGAIATLVIILFIVAAIAAPLVAPYDPNAIAPRVRMQGPSLAHWLGTDQLGRDLLSRVIYGTRTAFKVALLGTAGALVAGMAMGMIAGLGSKFIDSFLVLVNDSVKSLPLVLFALVLVSIYGPSMTTLIFVISASMAPGYFRVVRNQVLVLRNADFVVAAEAIGSTRFRLALTHLLPNLIGPIFVLVAMDIPAVIGIESGLSFLGQGVQPPQSSWGNMLAEGYTYVRQAPHIAVAAGLPIVMTTIAFTFLGEALRDVLDPRKVARR
ncbi:ABC transporter permease [Martelella radicis]|uniref:Peptide/nickel transport system permease protein n=1 Tax=Martelella radicis TaxID=1397476 RepID=A0A7W6P9I5_9HYPH|nr:ABC transporter permease [Martelella radicis]MBB4120417.1 peptide/nickel transport system permease protein [Martelella radicis]